MPTAHRVPTQLLDSFLEARFSDLREPELLPGVVAASERIYAAVQDKTPITIYGDYDADGMTGTSILFSCGVNFVQGNFLQEPEKVMAFETR